MYNVPSAKRRKKKFSPLNLIPILDVVFILIFFLLSTSQIIKFFEIGSDLPIYKVSSDEKLDKKNKFNLELIVDQNEVKFINTETDEVLHKVMTSWDQDSFYEALNEITIELKDQNKLENRVTLRVDKKIQYQNLIKVLDNLRQNNNDQKQSEKLFTQIMFKNR